MGGTSSSGGEQAQKFDEFTVVRRQKPDGEFGQRPQEQAQKFDEFTVRILAEVTDSIYMHDSIYAHAP